VLGHVTAEELRAKLVETEVANGYANRHLFALVRRAQLLPSGGDSDSPAIAKLGLRLRDSLIGARKIGFKRTVEAEVEWTRLYYLEADVNQVDCWGASSLATLHRYSAYHRSTGCLTVPARSTFST
jgi:hypothetical protein